MYKKYKEKLSDYPEELTPLQAAEYQYDLLVDLLECHLKQLDAIDDYDYLIHGEVSNDSLKEAIEDTKAKIDKQTEVINILRKYTQVVDR